MNICCGSWNVFSFNLLDEPFSFFLIVSFTSKYANSVKFACSSSMILYLQPTIYEKPSSPTVTEGAERNTVGRPETLELFIFKVNFTQLQKENNFKILNADNKS